MIRALPLALLLLLIGPLIGPYWSGVALLTWISVGTGLRAALDLKHAHDRPNTRR